MRVGEDRYLVTPSGMIYEEMVPDDVCLIDGTCRVVEGTRKPSSDSSALVYMFEHMPKVRAVIHTHQPWATAAGFAADEIPDFLVALGKAAAESGKDFAAWNTADPEAVKRIAAPYIA